MQLVSDPQKLQVGLVGIEADRINHVAFSPVNNRSSAE